MSKATVCIVVVVVLIGVRNNKVYKLTKKSVAFVRKDTDQGSEKKKMQHIYKLDRKITYTRTKKREVRKE